MKHRRFLPGKSLLIFLAVLLSFAVEASERMIMLCQDIPDSSMVEKFPYESYIREVDLFEIQKLIEDAAFLDSSRAPYAIDLFKNIFNTYPSIQSIEEIDINNVNKYIALGAQLLDSEIISLAIQGDGIMQRISSMIELKLENEEIDIDDEHVKRAIEQLAVNKYKVKPPTPSDFEKLKKNILEGEWGHITARFKSRCYTDCGNGFCHPMCVAFYAGLLLFFFLTSLLIYKYKFKKVIKDS